MLPLNDHKIRGILSRILPREAFIALYSATRTIALHLLSKETPAMVPPRNPITFYGITARNDIAIAEGFDKDAALLEFQYLIGMGIGVVGTIPCGEHTGNIMQYAGIQANPWTPLPYSKSALNSLGLPSKGVRIALRNIREFRQKHNPEDFPIAISIMPHPKDARLEKLARTAKEVIKEADILLINESCPNVHREDTGIEQRIETITRIRNEHGAKKYVPVFVKLANAGNPEHTIRYFTQTGIDGIVLTNSQKDYPQFMHKIDPRDKRLFDYYTKKYKGGLTGDAIKEYAFQQAQLASEEIERQQSHLKLIHVGGLFTPEDFAKSRTIPHTLARFWYTGFMEALATEEAYTIVEKRINP